MAPGLIATLVAWRRTHRPVPRSALRRCGAIVALAAATVAGCTAERESEAADETTESVTPTTVEVLGAEIHVERLAAEPATSDAPTVLLLHGAAFTSADWFGLGIAQGLAAAGIDVVAVDLPGFGRSTASAGERADVLPALLDALGLEPADTIVVSPSMSGTFSLPALRRPDLADLAGFVPVAPSGGSTFADGGPVLDIPALVVRGDGDGADPAAIAADLASAFAESEVWIVPDAGHPAYVDAPDEFVARVAAFALYQYSS